MSLEEPRIGLSTLHKNAATKPAHAANIHVPLVISVLFIHPLLPAHAFFMSTRT